MATLLDPTLNFGKVLVSGTYNGSATSITLSTGEGAKLPDPATDGAFNLVWWDSYHYMDPADDPNREIVRCTARSVDALTVVRGQESTSGTNKNTVNGVYRMILVLTKKQWDDNYSLIMHLPYVAKSASYPATANDCVIACTGPLTITLPTSVGATGKVYHIKKMNASGGGRDITVATTSSQTIDGATTQTINTQYTTLSVVSDGANWLII